MKLVHCIIFLISLSAFSYEKMDLVNVTDQEVIYDQDSNIDPTYFDEDKIKSFKNNDDFNYVEYVKQESWWTRFKNWLGQQFSKLIYWLFDVNEVTGFWALLLKTLPYLVILAVAFLLIWLFMKVSPNDMLLEKQSPGQVILTEDEDIIQNQDINELLNNALQQNNYRLAIRYYYLLILKKLTDHHIIDWEAQKTNTDYISEISSPALQQKFKIITRIYDFIWYGSFTIDEKSYKKAEKEFQSIQSEIK